ncbi:MAG: D-hexose-6-phosphate mutarotase [Phycisphaerae bacterium]|nr:MAG: D-hexose-6-phosphate mutarotase [Phycisphaerae bacterium]
MSKGFIQDLGNDVEMHGSLPRLVVKHRTASGEMFLHGSHITSWCPTGCEEVLYLSPRSQFSPGAAIRGGVPICFPWFGPHVQDASLPTHGFARTLPWEPVEHLSREDGVTIHTRLRSNANSEGRGNQFVIDYHVTFGPKLRMRFIINNVGKQGFDFELALHAYLAVSDVRNIRVGGLEGVEYVDKADGMRRKRQSEQWLNLEGETDRVYMGVESGCVVEDTGWARRILVEKSNSRSTVIWNPCETKAEQLKDLGAENWRGFVCVEPGNVGENKVHLEPGGRHEMAATIGVEGM